MDNFFSGQSQDQNYNFWKGNKGEAATNLDSEMNALQVQLNELQAGGGSQEKIDELIQKLEDLKSLKEYYKAQGLLNPDGTLKDIKDFQAGQVDKDYIAAKQRSIGEQTDLSYIQGMKEARKSELQGRQVQPGSILARVEAMQRSGSEQMTDAMKREKELGYQKAAGEVGREQQFSKNMAAEDRQKLLDGINIRLQEQAKQLGWSQQQIQLAQMELANADAGFLNKLIPSTADVLALYSMYRGGGGSGGSGGGSGSSGGLSGGDRSSR